MKFFEYMAHELIEKIKTKDFSIQEIIDSIKNEDGSFLIDDLYKEAEKQNIRYQEVEGWLKTSDSYYLRKNGLVCPISGEE